MRAAVISGDMGSEETIGPSMEAVPTSDTVIDPVAVVRIAATRKGSKKPRKGYAEKVLTTWS